MVPPKTFKLKSQSKRPSFLSRIDFEIQLNAEIFLIYSIAQWKMLTSLSPFENYCFPFRLLLIVRCYESTFTNPTPLTVTTIYSFSIIGIIVYFEKEQYVCTTLYPSSPKIRFFPKYCFFTQFFLKRNQN